MLRLAIDECVDNDIVRGVLRVVVECEGPGEIEARIVYLPFP